MARGEIYLIPLGYVLVEGSLYGVTERGHKTTLAEVDPNVAFQVDTSTTTGLFEWSSVTGKGSFSIVESEEERQPALSALAPLIAQAPDWWQAEQAERMKAGVLVVWKIVPSNISGRAYEP